ncbi:MAG: putative DNA-binding protein [Clostridia bacterium]|nr:putative DNA-binding protein [Clostridia bacterium]
MEDKVKICILLDIYENLLTEKQRELLNDYYNNDLSLSEIAENEGITRQAVRDNLKKGENNLLEYESKLSLMKNMQDREKLASDIEKILEKIPNIDESQLEKIKNTLNKMI